MRDAFRERPLRALLAASVFTALCVLAAAWIPSVPRKTPTGIDQPADWQDQAASTASSISLQTRLEKLTERVERLENADSRQP